MKKKPWVLRETWSDDHQELGHNLKAFMFVCRTWNSGKIRHTEQQDRSMDKFMALRFLTYVSLMVCLESARC